MAQLVVLTVMVTQELKLLAVVVEHQDQLPVEVVLAVQVLL